jgi:hypothetical protein
MPSSAFEEKKSDAASGARSIGVNRFHGFPEGEGRLAITIDSLDPTAVRHCVRRRAAAHSKKSHFCLLHRKPESDTLTNCIS